MVDERVTSVCDAGGKALTRKLQDRLRKPKQTEVELETSSRNSCPEYLKPALSVSQKEEDFGVWLSCGFLDSANRYLQARKIAAAMVLETKPWSWKQLREVMEKDI